MFKLIITSKKNHKKEWFRTEFEVNSNNKTMLFVFLKFIVVGYAYLNINTDTNIVECQFVFIRKFGTIKFIRETTEYIERKNKHALVWITEPNKIGQYLMLRGGLTKVAKISKYLEYKENKVSVLMYESGLRK